MTDKQNDAFPITVQDQSSREALDNFNQQLTALGITGKPAEIFIRMMATVLTSPEVSESQKIQFKNLNFGQICGNANFYNTTNIMLPDSLTAEFRNALNDEQKDTDISKAVEAVKKQQDWESFRKRYPGAIAALELLEKYSSLIRDPQISSGENQLQDSSSKVTTETVKSRFYNLIVTTENLSKQEPLMMDLSRCIYEYTDDEIVCEYRNSSNGDKPKATDALIRSKIDKLRGYPCLFTEETWRDGNDVTTNQPAFIGRIDRCIAHQSEVRIFWHIDYTLLRQDLYQILFELDIGGEEKIGELTRTHWALKEVDLFKELQDAHISLHAGYDPYSLEGLDVRDFDPNQPRERHPLNISELVRGNIQNSSQLPLFPGLWSEDAFGAEYYNLFVLPEEVKDTEFTLPNVCGNILHGSDPLNEELSRLGNEEIVRLLKYPCIVASVNKHDYMPAKGQIVYFGILDEIRVSKTVITISFKACRPLAQKDLLAYPAKFGIMDRPYFNDLCTWKWVLKKVNLYDTVEYLALLEEWG